MGKNKHVDRVKSTITRLPSSGGLFSHLRQFEVKKGSSSITDKAIHPAIMELGILYKENKILGSNARCVGLLEALKLYISDYECPKDKVLSRDLNKSLEPMIDYLTKCRPHSISMGNALNHVKLKISQLPADMKDSEAIESTIEEIDAFIEERIELTVKSIASSLAEKIQEGDVILTYGRSSSVELAFQMAHKTKKFTVIIIDSNPKFEGKILLRKLASQGINCEYVLISSFTTVCKHCTKFVVGSHAMLSNGTLVSRIGTAVVAMVANSLHIPVLVCCETYKFSYKIQLNAITKNEKGSASELVSKDLLSQWKKIPNIEVLNLIYDVTPSEYIDMVITEVGLIPATSVPVVLRETRAMNDPKLG